MLPPEHPTLPQNGYSRAVLERHGCGCGVLQHLPLIPALGRKRQAVVSLGLAWSTQSSSPAKAHSRTMSQKKKRKERKTRSPRPSVWDL